MIGSMRNRRIARVMETELLTHIGIPCLIVCALMAFKSATRSKPIGWENCNEMALELSILAIGATGGIFVDPLLIKRFGPNNGLYGITVVLVILVLSGVLIYREKWRVGRDTSAWEGLVDLFIGTLCVIVTSTVIYISH